MSNYAGLVLTNSSGSLALTSDVPTLIAPTSSTWVSTPLSNFVVDTSGLTITYAVGGSSNQLISLSVTISSDTPSNSIGLSVFQNGASIINTPIFALQTCGAADTPYSIYCEGLVEVAEGDVFTMLMQAGLTSDISFNSCSLLISGV